MQARLIHSLHKQSIAKARSIELLNNMKKLYNHISNLFYRKKIIDKTKDNSKNNLKVQFTCQSLWEAR
jgi:hypothetical protein